MAVLLIDMQDHFVDGLGEREEVAHLVLSQIAVLRRCQKENIPVIVLEYDGCGKTIPDLEAELTSIRMVIRVTKSQDSGFSGTKLDDKLRDLGVGTLLLMGINADACVLKTAKDARKLGYVVITNTELIACPNQTAASYGDWYRVNGVFVEKVPETLRALVAAKAT
jgi:nicotinamidase-related amidase